LAACEVGVVVAATMFVLISPTRLILMTSGEVDDAHLSALRAGLPLIDDS
jgi:hypothetical protein